MAIFYTLEAAGSSGERTLRWFVTEAEAQHARQDAGGGNVERREVDELQMRQWAASWASRIELMSEAAKRREASKTASQRSETMKKAWATRRASKR